MKEKLRAFVKEMYGDDVPTKRKFFNFVCIAAPLFSLAATIVNLISGSVRGDNSSFGLWACAICTVVCAGLYPLSKLFKNIDFLIYVVAFGLNFAVLPVLYLTVGGITSSMPTYFVVGIVFSVLMIDNKKIDIIIAFFSYAWYFLIMQLDQKYEIAARFSVLSGKSFYLDAYLDFVVASACIAVLVKILAISFERQQEKTNDLLDQMEELSIKDPLTGAYNRRFLIRYLESSIANAKEKGTNIAIVMFDIDKFKRINDDYGHLVGDEVIKVLANSLMSACRDYDIVSRYGGEEFILVMPGASEEIAIKRAEQIRMSFKDIKISGGIDRPVTISGGVAELTVSMQTPEDFIKSADDNLYVAKETGRNKIVGTTYHKLIPDVVKENLQNN
ncbi:MAG: GGDEF domain-containing protein [Clostridia bacterium]|nr:GGDEF domain-containing protein [Clostridia bacterium]